MFKQILLLCFLYMANTHNGLTQEKSFEKLMHTKNLTELNKLVQNSAKIKQLKTNCLLQLKNNKVPIFCYQWLKNQKSNKIKQILSYLDEKCIENLKFLKNLKIITKMIVQNHLSPNCRQGLKQKKQILEYQLKDHAPEKLLNWYLNF